MDQEKVIVADEQSPDTPEFPQPEPPRGFIAEWTVTIILLLFGGSILPRLARSSAKRMKESKDTLLATKTELEAGLRDLHGEGLGWFAYFEMLSFMATLAIGLVYVWRKGALEWS